MRVCDVCYAPDPEFSGEPMVHKENLGNEYLFRANGDSNGDAEIALCESCVTLFRKRSWDKLAERAQEVVMLRLGVRPKGRFSWLWRRDKDS